MNKEKQQQEEIFKELELGNYKEEETKPTTSYSEEFKEEILNLNE